LVIAGQGHLEMGAIVADLGHFGLEPKLGLLHLGAQHGDDVFGGVVAEKLAECFLVIADAVGGHERDEVPLCVAFERRFREMRVLADEIGRRGVHVGEIAPPATRDADFLACGFCVIYDEDIRARVGCAHHACGASADDKSFDLHKMGVPRKRV